jgi:hypothetical protein
LGIQRARNRWRRGREASRAAFVRRVSRTDGRPVVLGGRRVRARRDTAAAVAYRAAAVSSVPRGDRNAMRTPPVANPATWVIPFAMLKTERPRM